MIKVIYKKEEKDERLNIQKLINCAIKQNMTDPENVSA